MIVRLTDGYEVRKIDSKLGKEFVKAHHYSRGIHNGPMCYGMFMAQDLVGVLALATPSSEAVCSSVFGAEHKRSVTELHRLVLLDSVPKNGESWFIPRALKLFKADRPQYRAVLSFADSTQGHVGTIYRATNAWYCGMTAPAMFYMDADGRLRHPRQNGVNITKSDAQTRGWVPVKRQAKYRYLFPLAADRREMKWIRNNLLLEVQPYPKAGS